MGNGEALDPGAAPATPWPRSVSGVMMWGFLLVAGFYLLTEHTAHLWGVLPFLLLLSCPLMHLFHHHGHGKHAAGPPCAGQRAGRDMTHDAPAYGLWLLAAGNAALFIMFAFSFGKPQTPQDWRSFGMFSAFIVALFAERHRSPMGP